MIEQQAVLGLVAQAGAEDNFGQMMAVAVTSMKQALDVFEKVQRIKGEI